MSEPWVVVQARTGSSRFPRKVLADLHGAPMIVRQLERLALASPPVAVATSTDADDDDLAQVVEKAGVRVVRGPLEDVLARYVLAARELDADPVVRITADCPLADPELVDGVLATHRSSGADYASNIHPPTFPDGLDVEVVSRRALERADAEEADPRVREHVTLHVARRSDRFEHAAYPGAAASAEGRWTVDYEQDLAFVRAVYDALYPLHGPRFGYRDVEALLRARPELVQLQARAERNEALAAPD